MEEIDKRLGETTDAFIKSFDNWVKQSKNLESRETLMEAMHEVRKVISRIEIEIAISERDRLGSRPLPIPPHRSSRKQGGDEGDFGDDEGFNASDAQPSEQQHQPRRQHQPGGHRRRPMHGGGNRGGGGNGNGNGNNPGNNDSQS